MPETLELSPGESLTIVSEAPDALLMEAAYGPNKPPPPKHLHPDQDEHFEVVEGVLHADVGGETRVVKAGDTLDVPRRTPHTMWTADEPVRMRWTTSPAGRTAEWFRAVDRLRADGRTPTHEEGTALLAEYRDVFVLA